MSELNPYNEVELEDIAWLIESSLESEENYIQCASKIQEAGYTKIPNTPQPLTPEERAELVEDIGAELRKECEAEFGRSWSFDVAWKFARSAISTIEQHCTLGRKG